MNIRLYPVQLNRRNTQTIISNGSERGDFVPVSHIFDSLKYVHSGIQTIKVYNPNHPSWSPGQKISAFSKNKNIDYAWDYEYDDYDPFDLLEKDGKTHGEFTDIKKFGSDIHLSLTMDLSLSTEQLEKVFISLKKYGRIYLKINHESNGIWFSCNKQYTYKEVADFFIKCHKIIKNVAPDIVTVFNLSGGFSYAHGTVKRDDLRLNSYELAEALDVADFWSINMYASLNFGWPFYKKEDNKFDAGDVMMWWRNLAEIYLKMIWVNKMTMKPLFINEFNADSDIDGFEGQAEAIRSVYEHIREGELDWLKGMTYYQFRDKGGLGLETGDLSDYTVMPSFHAYKDAIRKFKYEIKSDDNEWKRKDYVFNWTDSETIRGLKIISGTGIKTFTNLFSAPIFIINDRQDWMHIKENEPVNLQGISEFIICMPPHTTGKNELSYFKLETDIAKMISSMITNS